MKRFILTLTVLGCALLAAQAQPGRGGAAFQRPQVECNFDPYVATPAGFDKMRQGIDRGAGHSFYMSASQVEDNVYTIMATAMDLATFEGVEGNVMRLTVTASDNFTAQGSELTLANVVLVTDESQELLADDAMTRISETSGIDDITAIRQIDTIRYINVAGQESDMPFDGVNIVVTTYTDGTSTTVKVIK